MKNGHIFFKTAITIWAIFYLLFPIVPRYFRGICSAFSFTSIAFACLKQVCICKIKKQLIQNVRAKTYRFVFPFQSQAILLAFNPIQCIQTTFLLRISASKT